MEPIAFEKFTLPNGLDVILHQDATLPLVAVNVWYHVGSKDEETGKTGFAHLFEHIMFEGSKHHNSSHFEPLQQVGASLNGSTDTDRTNYWENLPSNYLELALWLEADRMGFLLDALDQRRFDIQRDVVKNERRQSYENRPYGIAELRLQSALYPPPHPYHWPTIGFHEDLDAATLEDVRAFFRRFYSPSNASLAIAGDFQQEETRNLVERYFGDLAPSPALPRARRTDSLLQGHADITLYDKVLLPRVYLAWPTVPRFHEDEAALSILAAILGSGKSSRLHRSLVHERRIAQSVSAFQDAEEVAGDFLVEVTAAADHTAGEMQQAAQAEIERMRQQQPSSEEMARTKNMIEWHHVRQRTRIGGFGGKANLLNSFNVFAQDPELVNSDLERYLAVQPEDVRRVADTYLADRRVQLVVLPEPARHRSTATIDRSTQPPPVALRPFVAPIPRRQSLANGLQLLVLEKRGIPSVAFSLVLNQGANMDGTALPGLAAFASSMLQEGTENRSSNQIADEFEFMGSQLSSATGREQTNLAAEILSRHWPAALEIVADLVQNPTFPEQELNRVRRQRLTSIRRLRDDAAALAGQAAPILLYGRENPYGHPISGTERSLEALTRQNAVDHFQAVWRPENATLVVVGDASMEEVEGLAKKYLGSWKGQGVAAKSLDATPKTPKRSATALYLIDKPGAAQSEIRAGYVGVPRQHPDYLPLVVLNNLFGGQFTARLNANLRQNKGYSYGYHSSIDWYRSSSLMVAGGAVQTEVTREAVVETMREFRDIAGSRPVDEAEFDSAKASLLRQFPSSFETPGQVLSQLTNVVSFDLPDDYYRTLSDRLQAVSLADVRRAAQEWVDPDRLLLVVVGDREAIEPGLRELDLEVHLVDHEVREA
jgi:zinc protease